MGSPLPQFYSPNSHFQKRLELIILVSSVLYLCVTSPIKIISKVVANYLKPLLPLIIPPKQFGYVEGHQILDRIILAHKITHSLKNYKTPWMLLKLDFSKSFEKLSWGFIERTLLAFGFYRA